MTLDEYVTICHQAAVLFGQRFTRDDLCVAYDHAADWLHPCPTTAGHQAVRWLARLTEMRQREAG